MKKRSVNNLDRPRARDRLTHVSAAAVTFIVWQLPYPAVPAGRALMSLQQLRLGRHVTALRCQQRIPRLHNENPCGDSQRWNEINVFGVFSLSRFPGIFYCTNKHIYMPRTNVSYSFRQKSEYGSGFRLFSYAA